MQARARIAKAQADSRALASAASIYGAHMSNVPPSLAALTAVASNALGQTAGPFMATIPSAPTGWQQYQYSPNSAAGTFNISTSGDGTTVSLP